MFAFAPEIFIQLPFHEGGTAGNVLANRLTEDRESSVLILKASGTQVPAYLVTEKQL